jgi:hypothetical protein
MPSKRITEKSAPKLGWLGFAPFVLIALVLLAGAVWLLWNHFASEAAKQSRQQQNTKLGIPSDYPSQLIPIYPGVKLVESKRENAQATDGKPMDKWYIHATSTDSTDKLHDYYMDIVTKLNLNQTMGMQIPTGYGFNYANENMIVEFTIETRAPDPLTQLEITVYVLQ